MTGRHISLLQSPNNVNDNIPVVFVCNKPMKIVLQRPPIVVGTAIKLRLKHNQKQRSTTKTYRHLTYMGNGKKKRNKRKRLANLARKLSQSYGDANNQYLKADLIGKKTRFFFHVLLHFVCVIFNNCKRWRLLVQLAALYEHFVKEDKEKRVNSFEDTM